MKNVFKAIKNSVADSQTTANVKNILKAAGRDISEAGNQLAMLRNKSLLSTYLQQEKNTEDNGGKLISISDAEDSFSSEDGEFIVVKRIMRAKDYFESDSSEAEIKPGSSSSLFQWNIVVIDDELGNTEYHIDNNNFTMPKGYCIVGKATGELTGKKVGSIDPLTITNGDVVTLETPGVVVVELSDVSFLRKS